MLKKITTIYPKLIILFVIAVIVMGCSAYAAPGGNSAPSRDGAPSQPLPQEQPAKESGQVAAPKFKILHIMSYHSPWEWTDGQFNGFKSALKDVDVEYKVIQMDTKNNSSEEWKQQVAQEAKDLIDSWQPDLVYTTDDDVQKYVAKDYVNKDIPFVFSAVNADPPNMVSSAVRMLRA
jgi:hypothetical protein